IHHGREARERTGAQVVAIREAAWNDDRIVRTQIRVTMPDEINGLADVLRDYVISIVIAVRAWKNYDAEFHLLNLHSVVFNHRIRQDFNRYTWMFLFGVLFSNVGYFF